MKPIYLILCLLFSALTMLTLSGCTKDNEANPNKISLSELPSKAGYFLLDIFSNQEPVLVEKASKEENNYSFRVTYPDDVAICFDENGGWKLINIPGEQTPEGISKHFQEMVHYTNTVYQTNRIKSITRTDYGQFATLDNEKTVAFSEEFYLGEELGQEGYSSLPPGIQSFIKEYFIGAGYKYVTVDQQANETSVYKYRISLDKGYKAWFDVDGNWKYITSLSNETDNSLPLDLINILPEKIRKEVASITKLVTIYKKNETLYEIGTSRTDIKTYTTEVIPPTDLHQKEVKEFIDTYFESESSYRLTVPAHVADPYYHVRLPNGFDFRLDKTLQWDLIDGHGYPFTTKLLALVPEKILTDSRIKKYITAIRRDENGYYINLIGNYYLQYDADGNYDGQQHSPAPYDKAYTYVRYTYPKDIGIQYLSWEGFVFKLSDGTKINFDSTGKPIE
ncbi:PepSY-like domain-containing protein [Parabacteroides provencensis]|uniref:PepSY-like domain-containing protein n=1 Tax=Parabacteroides provencensis TaxID=1944636 RepID=UPI000C15014B|nr:PepSY-like domain-containing protein [Parabacteroides provencensis]